MIDDNAVEIINYVFIINSSKFLHSFSLEIYKELVFRKQYMIDDNALIPELNILLCHNVP